MRRSVAPFFTLLTIVGFVSVATAAPPGRADSRLWAPERRGVPSTLRPRVQADGTVAALLRAPQLDDVGRKRLEDRGLSFRRTERGTLVRIGAVHVVDGPLDLLRALATEGVTIQLARPVPPSTGSTEATAAAARIDALVQSGSTPLSGPTGAGRAVLDIDSGIDPFHPHFFRADAGVYPFRDTDGDGVLTPDVDGVDLDGDGVIAEEEVLHLMEQRLLYSDPMTSLARDIGRDGRLDPALDWLWLDSDGDGYRTYGPEAGFDDRDPAFGEPLFVPDDADGDGIIAEPEALVRLGSSRILGVRTLDRVHRRDDDLTDLLVDAPDEIGHGTGVSGILVGGQLWPQPRPHGLLPEADLLLFDDRGADDADVVEAIEWGVEEGAEVVLFEYASWYGDPLDGSGAIPELLAQIADDGIVPVCPAGNLGGAGKHGVTEAVDGAFAFHLRLDSFLVEQLTYLVLELHLPPPMDELECTITDSEGVAFSPDWTAHERPMGDLTTWTSQDESDRGQSWRSMWFYEGRFAAGTWTATCVDPEGHDGAVHAYLDDGWSWSRGVYFLEEDDRSTLCQPATADACVALGAFGATLGYYDGEQPGERHYYSGVGPRIDGGRTLDLTAPADPFTAMPLLAADDPNSAPYQLFSGTSGAGPHVAAAALLLKELHPDEDGREIRQRLRDGARVDEVVSGEVGDRPLPDDAWGHGKLDAMGAAEEVATGDAPEAPIAVEMSFGLQKVGDRCRVESTAVSSAAPGLLARWDLDYDGVWETEFQAEPWVWEAAPGEERLLRVQAAIGGAWIGGLASWWTVPGPCEDGSACGGCTASGRDGAGGAGVALVGLILLRRRARLRTTAGSSRPGGGQTRSIPTLRCGYIFNAAQACSNTRTEIRDKSWC